MRPCDTCGKPTTDAMARCEHAAERRANELHTRTVEGKLQLMETDVAKVLEGFDKQVFIRDISGDGESDWAIKLYPYVQALAQLQQAVDEHTKEKRP